MNTLKYKRVLLKLSGEALQGSTNSGNNFNKEAADQIVVEIEKLYNTGAQIAIVIGGGNICRGKTLSEHGVERTLADYMGMVATTINGMYLHAALEEKDIPNRVMSAIKIEAVAEGFIYKRALKHMDANRVVILTGGSGNPFSTTDTAAALRARELNCDVIIKATKVDGIYDKDPVKYPDAKKYDKLTYRDAISEGLEVMDLTAFTMCQESNIPIIVCDILGKDNLKEIVNGANIGTYVNGEIKD